MLTPPPLPPVRPDPAHVATERELREDLACAYRLFAHFRHDGFGLHPPLHARAG
jgi:hypothetical protein